MALKCPKCGYVFLPPRPACGECHVPLEEWVEVNDKGTVKAFTAIHFRFYDANLGRERPVPFGSALIQLDGADSLLNHYLDEFSRSFRDPWPTVRQQLLDGTYEPSPARRKAIPKPDGSQRDLGIPHVQERLIQ